LNICVDKPVCVGIINTGMVKCKQNRQTNNFVTNVWKNLLRSGLKENFNYD